MRVIAGKELVKWLETAKIVLSAQIVEVQVVEKQYKLQLKGVFDADDLKRLVRMVERMERMGA